MLQSACSPDATEGAHGHGGAASAGNDDALWAVRVCPHLMRPALPDYRPPRLSQRCAHLPVLLGHDFDRIARCGHASVLGWPDRPPHNLDGAPPERSVGAPARRQQRGAGTLQACLVPARSRPSAAADSRCRPRSARSGSRDVPVRVRPSILPLFPESILVADRRAPGAGSTSVPCLGETQALDYRIWRRAGQGQLQRVGPASVALGVRVERDRDRARSVLLLRRQTALARRAIAMSLPTDRVQDFAPYSRRMHAPSRLSG